MTNVNNFDVNCNIVRFDYGCEWNKSDIQILESDAKTCDEGANRRG